MATGKNPLFDTATTLGKILLFLGVSAICGVLVAGLLVPAAAVTGSSASGSIQFFDTLPAELKVDPPSQSTKILAADGSVIANLYLENRTRVSLDDMSPHIKNAVIAIEDSRFYEHGGVDTTGIMRALVSTARGNKQGASTITQQYVNNVINSSLEAEGKGDEVLLNGVNKGVGDKLREMKLAIALEKKFTKEEILEGYLNIVFFNRDAYGIEAASRLFFSTTAKKLTLPQAALLAGVVNSPSFYDPISNPENAKNRRDLVLKAMYTQGKIKQADYEAAVATPVTTKVTQPRQGCAYSPTSPYFCDYVLHLLLNNPAYGADAKERERKVFRGGLTIKTTLEPAAQKAAQAQVDAAAGANPDKWGAALVSVEPGTGKITNMAQNTSWLPAKGKFDSQLNFNVDKFDEKGNDLNGLGGAQPGSTMKPFTFAQWLDEGKSMNTVVDGSVRKYPLNFQWRNSCGTTTGAYNSAEEGLGAAPDLQNAEEGYYKPMTVLRGLYNSINTVTFASAAQLDFCGIQKIVDAVGIHNGLDNSPVNMSVVANLLGSTQTSPLTMASAFATFANDGRYCAPIAITSVTDATGAQLPAQATELPGRAQAGGRPRRELRAAGGPEPRFRFAHSAEDLHPDQLPDRGQDRYVEQQRFHLGRRPHHGPRDGRLVRRPAGQPEARRAEHHDQRELLQGHRRLHDRRPHVLPVHGADRPLARHGAVPGTAVEPVVRSRAVPAAQQQQQRQQQQRATEGSVDGERRPEGTGAVRTAEGREEVARGRGI